MARQLSRGAAAGAGVIAAVASLAGLAVLGGAGSEGDRPTSQQAGAGSVSSSTRPAGSAGTAPAGSLGTGTSGRQITRGLAGQAAPGAVLPGPAPAVLPPFDVAAPAPNPAVLQARLSPLVADPALAGAVSVDVVDAVTGQHLAASGATTPRTPASTAKVLTAAAALALIGPDTPLRTRVVAGPTPDEILLVGGGDVMMSAGSGDPVAVDGRAGLDDLAAATAAALKAKGRTQVAVRLDDRLFAGPSVSAGWPTGSIDAGFVAPVMAIEVHTGKVVGSDSNKRVADPAMAAAKAFTGALGKHGISVAGAVARATADSTAEELAAVESAPLADIVELALTSSDNTVAEALARLVAWRAARPATFEDAGVAVLDQVSLLGVPVAGARLVDGSGLGSASKVPPATLTGLLALAASERHPELRHLLTGLPVAGASGTLADRFETGGLRVAAGLVRAKTGTLNGVHSLAGTVLDVDGRLLVFAVLADAAPRPEPALKAIDSIAATLAGCGCR